MSIASDKQNIANSLSTITSLSSSLDTASNNSNDLNVNTFNTDSKDPIDFILSLFGVIIGVEVLKGLTKDVLNKNLPDIGTQIKNTMKSSILNENEDKNMDTTFANAGYDFKVSELDYGKKLKSTPENNMATESGSLDDAMMKAINNVGSVQTYNNLTVQYNATDDTMKVKPNNPSQTTNQFLVELIDSLNFLNQPLIIALVVDLLFGTLRKKKSRNQIANDELYNTIIQNLISDDSNDTYYEIDPNQLIQINNTTNNIINGLLPLDFDCGIVESEYSIYSLDTLMNSADPIEAFDKELDNILPSDPKSGNRDDLSPSNLHNTNSSISGNNKYNNKSATKNKIYKGFMNAIITVLTKNTTLSPQGILLISLSKRLAGDVSPIGSGVDLIKNNKNVIQCIAKNIKSTMTTFLYNKLKKEVIKIVKAFTVTIINEKINGYYGILQSLTHIT